MKDLLDLRALLVPLAHLALLDLLAPSVTQAKGDLLVRQVCLELMECLDLLEPQSCCLSVLARVVETKARRCRLRKPRQQPSCLKPGWLLKDLLAQWDSLDALDLMEIQEVLVSKEKVATQDLRAQGECPV